MNRQYKVRKISQTHFWTLSSRSQHSVHNTKHLPLHFSQVSSPSMATVPLSFSPKTLTLHSHPKTSSLIFNTVTGLRFGWNPPDSSTTRIRTRTLIRAAVDGEYSPKRSNSGEQRETIKLPGCDYNHWLIVMEFPKDPAPTREQMIDTYLNTLATVLGRLVRLSSSPWPFLNVLLFLFASKK